MILEVKVEYKIRAIKHKIDLRVFQLPELMKLLCQKIKLCLMPIKENYLLKEIIE